VGTLLTALAALDQENRTLRVRIAGVEEECAVLKAAHDALVREREQGPTYKTLFERVMDTWGKHANADEALCDEMCRILGAAPDDPNTWPFEDTGWDWHDMSVELYGVRPGVLLTPEQLDRFWLTGFDVLYVNYPDLTGRSYSKRRGYEPSELRTGQRDVPSHTERQKRQLQAALDAARARFVEVEGHLRYAPPMLCRDCIKEMPCGALPPCGSRVTHWQAALDLATLGGRGGA
jgi:hypothetical protein